MKSGIKEAIKQQCDIVVKMDGDGQMDAKYLKELVIPLIQKPC